VRTATAAAVRRGRSRTLGGDFERLASMAAATKTVGFGIYKDDAVGFQRDVLGYTPVEPQVRVFEALQRSNRVAVPSGRAMGKSRLDAGAALHFAATQGPNACVILIAPTFRQIQVILWEELRQLYYSAKRPLGGDCAKLANTGLRLADGSRIFGVTGDQPEAIQGIRSPRMMVIVDEASGVPDGIFTALEGNLAGGGVLLETGNPTRATGHFRESCRGERYDVVPLPSTSSPNVLAGDVVVPGLATLEWIEERRQEWGEDSPLFKIHVLGEFVELAEGRLFSEEMIADAERRWETTQATGRLVIGIDPAGESGDGDESAFAARRGKRVLQLTARRGLTPDGHVVEALGIARTLLGGGRRSPAERPLLVVDRDGYVGAKVYAALAAYQSQHEHAYELRGVRGGERAKRRPLEIDRVRDEVWLSLVDAFRDGLAIPEDVKLSRELAAIRLERHVSGRSKITSKDELRRELGRSPDRADALALCAAIEPSVEETASEPRREAPDPYDAEPERTLDPYAAMGAWR
jgi:phage terminase large subunit